MWSAILRWIVGPIAGPAFGVAAILLAIGWTTTAIITRAELSSVTADRDRLKASIDDPATGYVAKNAQCETNVAQLQAGLAKTSADIAKLGADTEANGRRIAALMAANGKLAATTKAAADKLLALPAMAPIGSIEACTAGARILKSGAP